MPILLLLFNISASLKQTIIFIHLNRNIILDHKIEIITNTCIVFKL